MLIIGGVRSGKSRLAEQVAMTYPDVTYVAPGPLPSEDDVEWSRRVAEHRARRPAHWRTVETGDVPAAITYSGTTGEQARQGSAVLVDCLGTWTTRFLDDAGAWDDRKAASHLVQAQAEALTEAVRAADRAGIAVILVTNEVGLGVVPAHASGRLFRDALGRVNQAASTMCEHVAFVVAGRVLDLSDSPTVDAFAAAWGATNAHTRNA